MAVAYSSIIYDQARFGLLFARGGEWKNQQLVSADWTEAVHKPSSANRSYGFLWWTNHNNDLGNVSKDIYTAQGYGGNYIVVDCAK